MQTETTSDTRCEATSETATPAAPSRTGRCHCGAVRFRAAVDARVGSRCNCSICTKIGATGAVVRPEAFTLLTPEAELATYAWGGMTGTRFFCRRCGIHCLLRGSLPELGGAYVALNLNCLDDFDPAEVKLTYWDGRHDNWDAGPRETPWPVRQPPGKVA